VVPTVVARLSYRCRKPRAWSPATVPSCCFSRLERFRTGGGRASHFRLNVMCTLTFLPTADGYLAGMNRDELRTRPVSRPPQVRKNGGTEALYPTEPSGGTWMACSQRGILLALLNWNDIEPGDLHTKTKSRGFVIPTLIGAQNLAAVDSTFERMPLEGVLPL